VARAVVVREPGQVAIETLPDLEPGRHQVLCEHLYGSVCAATDQHLIAGELPLPGIAYPLILGHETIGRVVAVGPDVRYLKVGDLVTRTGYPETDTHKAFWGGFASHGLAWDTRAMREDGVAEDDIQAHAINQRLPGDINPAAATMMITWRETYSYLSRMGIPEGCSVLVLGSGGNGFSFAVLARALGAGRVAIVGNPRWEALAREAGVDDFVDYRDPAAVQALAGPFDRIVDAVGKTGGLEAVQDELADGGRIGIYGIEDLGERMAYLGKLTEAGIDARGPGEYAEAEAHDAVVSLLTSGQLDAGLWFDLDAPVALEDFPEAIEQIKGRKTLKALVRLSGG